MTGGGNGGPRLELLHDKAEHAGVMRLTLTPPVLSAARCVAFIGGGASKRDALRAVLEGPKDVDRWPAQVVAPTSGTLVFLADTDAGSIGSSGAARELGHPGRAHETDG